MAGLIFFILERSDKVARNVEKLRQYYLGKDPQLKETMADNSLRLIGIEGKYYVLRSELLMRLGILKNQLLNGEIQELQDSLHQLEEELTNYYTKSETDTRIDEVIEAKLLPLTSSEMNSIFNF